MTATLYINNSDIRYLEKSLTKISDVTITLKEDTNRATPTIILSNNAYDSRCNYVYIDTFNRFYSVTDVTYSQQKYYITLKRDSKTSFSAALKNCDCIALRSSNKYNMYLDDNQYTRLQYNEVYTKPFPNAFSKTLNYILMIAG